MSLTFQVLTDPADLGQLTNYLDELGRRASRAEILPILMAHLEPIVQAEKAILADHTQSGALIQSLKARAGGGDRPGVVSVFAAPTATPTQLGSTWNRRGRKQQKRWAAALSSSGGRRKVFYAVPLHQGHRWMRRNAAGELYEIDREPAQPVPFAQEAADAMAEKQAEAAGEAILNHVVGED